MPETSSSTYQHNSSSLDVSLESVHRNEAATIKPWQPASNILISQSNVQDFSIGTGRTIFASTLLPAILSAKQEVILATCFWAPGPTLDQLCLTLKQLSRQVISSSTRKVRVYICFSSRSLWQKLFHTSSPDGYIYPPETWAAQLGLPSPTEIPGLELQVKSLFFRPFSVLHSKYLIIDRRDVWLPSCNVSWEEWYECNIHLSGPVVGQVFDFWKGVWDLENRVALNIASGSPLRAVISGSAANLGLQMFKQQSFPDQHPLRTTLLPHPHSTSLRLNLWLWPFHSTQSPATPLNTTILDLFARARSSITILTPNFTSGPVYHALLAVLKRGVDVRLITNRKMMILEQLVTSGSISEWWVWKLRRAHRKLVRGKSIRATDIAANTAQPFGALRIDCFSPPVSRQRGNAVEDAEQGYGIAAEAVKTHIKLTMVDGEYLVLGSGNMDRASWYTSQELGILLEGAEHVNKVWSVVEDGLEGCLDSSFW